MKTTVKTQTGRAVIYPLRTSGEIILSIAHQHGEGLALVLTADQAGALVFGIEQALETVEAAHIRAIEAIREGARGVRCHDADLCQAGQTACPSPAACGVAA